jgi:hypothetical protein
MMPSRQSSTENATTDRWLRSTPFLLATGVVALDGRVINRHCVQKCACPTKGRLTRTTALIDTERSVTRAQLV